VSNVRAWVTSCVIAKVAAFAQGQRSNRRSASKPATSEIGADGVASSTGGVPPLAGSASRTPLPDPWGAHISPCARVGIRIYASSRKGDRSLACPGGASTQVISDARMGSPQKKFCGSIGKSTLASRPGYRAPASRTACSILCARTSSLKPAAFPLISIHTRITYTPPGQAKPSVPS
jgi:hypothetical protein